MMSPKISVVIPTFNSGKTIDRTLTSVFNQTYRPYEIVVIDDGSSDDTVKKLNVYSSQITLFVQVNSGASSARNKGVELSSGEVIAFLDSDDVWHKDKLKLQSQVFTQQSDVGICSTAFKVGFDDGKIDTEKFCASNSKLLSFKKINFKDVFLHPYLATPTVAIKKNIFEKLGGFDETLETAEDVDLWLRACYMTPYMFVENELCYVMGQEQSLSTMAKKSTFESHLLVIEKFCGLQKEFAQKNISLLKKSKSSVYTQWGSAELTQNRFKSAANKLFTAIKHKPSSRAMYLFFKAIFLYLKSST